MVGTLRNLLTNWAVTGDSTKSMVGRGVGENIGVGSAEVLWCPEIVYRDKLRSFPSPFLGV